MSLSEFCILKDLQFNDGSDISLSGAWLDTEGAVFASRRVPCPSDERTFRNNPWPGWLWPPAGMLPASVLLGGHLACCTSLEWLVAGLPAFGTLQQQAWRGL